MKKSRSQKIAKNVTFNILTEVIKLACGLILPRLILANYGSAYNGIVQSISQFLMCIAFMKMGIGDVTRAALFKPLAEKNNDEISEVLASTEAFMRKIAKLFLGFVFIFACIYPIIISNEFGWLFTASLVIIISISTFAEYYFGFTYQMLIEADQKDYIISILSIVSIVLNTMISIVLINNNYSIHVVKLASSLSNVITPVFLYIYCHNNYGIKYIKKPGTNKLPQRWDAFAHEVASFVNDNTDIMLLTLFTSLLEVSVYTVYHYVISNMKKIVISLTASFSSAFGDMYAKGEKKLFYENFRIYELLIYSFSSILYSTTLAVIVPFVMLYTRGVNDVNYNRELFAILMTLAGTFDIIRLPYKSVIKCTGFFKETKKIAIYEVIINLVLSIILVIKYGIIGVVIGTLTTMLFGAINYSNFISNRIMKRNKKEMYFHLFLEVIIMIITFGISRIYIIKIVNYYSWILYSAITCLLSIILTVLFNIIFYKDDLKRTAIKIRRTINKKSNV